MRVVGEVSLPKIESIQEHISSQEVVSEHSKWTVNHVLEQMKEDIVSVSLQPDKEKRN